MTASTNAPSDARPNSNADDWFAHADARTDERGLRFECTMCGNCCSGPPGYVSFTADEASAIARLLGISLDDFFERYTMNTVAGTSLGEVDRPPHGLDCIFLDRETIPGRAVCAIYEARPAQCRTWPFWPSVLRSASTWQQAGRTCPGIGRGPLHEPAVIRVTRDRVQI